MAHYAFLDENNIVTDVITGLDETELIEGLSPEEWYGNFRGQRCVRTSYNASIRKNYAGIGMVYDESRDIFTWPKKFDSWTFNEETCLWEAPIPKPVDDEWYVWNESTLSWEKG
jgi:hypothetical protein